MKQGWTVFVLFVYINETNFLLTRAEQPFLYSYDAHDYIRCQEPSVIKIEKPVIVKENSSCSRNTCTLSDDEFGRIEDTCNGITSCNVDLQLNTSCLRENRYFNLSFMCLAPTNLACNFEFSLCNWKQISTINTGNWTRNSTVTSNIRYPDKDHTTNSSTGYFLYLTKHDQLIPPQGISRTISFNGDTCLEFWYYMDHKSTLRIYKKDSNEDLKTISVQKSMSKTWQHASVDLIHSVPYEIVLEGNLHNNDNAYIAVDDIDIQDWPCHAAQPVRCNFERDLCDFRVSPPTYVQNWKRYEIGSSWILGSKPSIDHTKKANGSYVFTESIKYSINYRRWILIQLANTEAVSCLSFWYYVYGENPGHLNIYEMENGTEQILSSITDTKKTLWIQFMLNVYNTELIILEYNFTNVNIGGIALDDVYISPVKCADEEPSFHQCVNTHGDFRIQCPVSNVWNEAFVYDPNLSIACQNTFDIILQDKFRQCNDAGMCVLKPNEVLDNNIDYDCLLASKTLLVNYSCAEPTSPETTDLQTSSPQTDDTRSVGKMTQTAVNTPQTDTRSAGETTQIVVNTTQTDVPDNLLSSSPSSTPVIGIVIGVVLSLIALSVFLVVVVIYFKRYRYAEKKGHSIIANKDSHSDYTGHQNIAFSPEVNVTTQTDYCEIRKSKLHEHYHDISDTFCPSINTTNDDEYSEIANVVNSPNNNPNPFTNYQHQYISLDPNATGFDRSIPQNNLHNESKNNQNSNEKTSITGVDDYAILDPDDLNESKNNIPKVLPLSDNYVVLDPKETGFNRQDSTDTVCNYELATSINPTETSEDPYDVSKDETYDTSCNSRNKEKENNIYSHMVDNVYDTAGNQRKKEDDDGTYDHFYGQQSEDDYDISKPL